MKKFVVAAVAAAVLIVAGFLVYQFRPEKRYANHVAKARMYAKESNYAAAVKEYEKAYSFRGGFKPYNDIETLKLTNTIHLQKGETDSALANSKKFVATYPTNKEGKLVLAELAFVAGDVEAAMGALTALFAIDPKDTRGRMLMASLRMRQRRMDLAEEEFRILSDASPDSVGILLPLARTLLEQGKLEEARAILRKILARQPKDTSANLVLTDTYLREGKADSAHAVLDAWKDADPAVAMQVALRKARLLSLQQRYDSALAVLSGYANLSKENAPALNEIAGVKAKQGHLDSAIGLYSQLKDLKITPSGQADVLIALLHLADHQPARCLEALKRLQIGGRNQILAAYELATLVAMDQPQKAEELIQSVEDSLQAPLKALRDNLPPTREIIGGWALINYYQFLGEAYWANRVTDSLYRRWPEVPMLARAYAPLLAQARQPGRAAAVIGSLKNPTPSDRMQRVEYLLLARDVKPALALAEGLRRELPSQKGLNLLMADMHRAMGNRARMLEHYRNELALDPANPIAVNNLAWEHGVVDRDYVQAEPYLRKLEASKHVDPRILDTIGWILALNGKLEESSRYFDLALILLPDNPTLLYHKAWLLIKQGRGPEGKAMLEKAVASPVNFGEKAEAKKLLADQA